MTTLRCVFALATMLAAGAWAQPASAPAAAATDTERQLLERIRILEERVAALESRQAPRAEVPAPVAPAALVAKPETSSTGDSLSLPGFAAGTTVNLLLDGYYEYNFAHPADRVNLLRYYDPTSNSFTLNQAAVIVERAPDPTHGRRFGMRLDLMFGQATESLSGNPANELRTAPYRNIFQAYGTYVVPLGKGVSVDFGRFVSPLGMEGHFAKDQINYTRSLIFTAMPAYHMGFRTSYPIGDKTTVTWLLVNGVNQTEDFNGFKSNHFMVTTALAKTVSWTGSYYVGREGLPLAAERADGRTHIGDTSLSWNATPKLTLAGEGSYILSRRLSNAPPVHFAGGAGYLKYQFLPAFALGGRFEYTTDRGGYLGGPSQTVKETTITATYQPLDGFQMRWEFRRDFSNQPFFLSTNPGVLKKDQNTAVVGLLWWFGGKQGSW